MDKFTQQFTNVSEKYSDVITTFADLANESLENAQKITGLQYKAASDFIEHSANVTKDLFNAKTSVQAANIIKDFAGSSVEATLEKRKEILNVLTKSQELFKDAANTSFKNASDLILGSIDQVAKVNPSWSKAASESVQKVIDATSKAQETFEKVADQVSIITNKNVEAAANTALNTIKKTNANGFAARK